MMKDNTARKLNNQTQRAEILNFPAIQPLPKKSYKGLFWKIPFTVLAAGLIVGGAWWVHHEPTVAPQPTANIMEVEMLSSVDTAVSHLAHATILAANRSTAAANSIAEEANVKDSSDDLGGVVAPVAYAEKNMTVRLTNMYGVTLEDALVDGRWMLREDQDVLVWMDLPTDIEQLDGKVESTFPYEVKAGETGVIEIAVTSYEDETIYNGTLEFVAEDDLTLEAGVRHNPHSNSGDIQFWNDNAYEMNCLSDILGKGKKSYMHYALFTSAENEPIVFCGGYSSVGYNMQYDVRAIGDFDNDGYIYVHGGTYYEGLKGKMLPCEPAPGEVEELNDSTPTLLPPEFDAEGISL